MSNNKMKTIKSSKHLVITICIFILSASILFIATYAWMKTNDKKTNDFRGANLEAAITETFTPDEGVVPDVPYEKEVSVTNSQNQPIFVRVMAMPEISYFDGTNTVMLDPTVLTIDVNTTDWTDGGDGYYYYRHSLAPGQTTQKLFTSVVLPSTVGDDYDGAMIYMMVQSETTVISKTNSYRTSWWGGTTPTTAPLSTIDTELQAIVTAEGV